LKVDRTKRGDARAGATENGKRGGRHGDTSEPRRSVSDQQAGAGVHFGSGFRLSWFGVWSLGFRV